jgi:RimJ/RimL family protein N-acetyltransferase
VDLEGIWLEVLAVALDHQHGGLGQAAYELTIDHLRTVERDSDHLAGLVHIDNHRTKRLLTAVGWSSIARWDDHELWVGAL